MKNSIERVSAVVLLSLAATAFAQESRALPGNKGFATIKEILVRSCSSCHTWTGSYEEILKDGGVVPGKPEESRIFTQIESDAMPMTGAKLSADEKAFIRGWILAGAPQSELPISVAGAAPGAAVARPGIKLPFHEVSGFTSVALFGAAGVLGVIHYLDMKNIIHPNGTEGDGTGDGENFSQMTQIWNSQQSLRWWHTGFVIGGEVLYVGNAITGLTMLTPHVPGRVTKSDIHRWAFWTHLTLMAAQVGLGFLETDALSRGLHDQAIWYTGAHAVIGVVIPAIMLYSGLENVLP